MDLNRRKFAKNPIDWSRRKFLIDHGFADGDSAGAFPLLRNRSRRVAETRRSPSALNELARGRQKPRRRVVFAARPCGLSVRLISL
jgi:hypothetical protein